MPVKHAGENIAPSPGNWTVCCDCSAIARFADDLTLRPVTADEIDDLRARDPAAYEALLWARQEIQLMLMQRKFQTHVDALFEQFGDRHAQREA